MNYAYIDASAGISGDMILGALMDLGISSSVFKEKMSKLKLPIDIEIKEVRKQSLRGMKVNIIVNKKNHSSRKLSDINGFIQNIPFPSSVKKKSMDIFSNLFKAESRVHGSELSEAHLHEAGADDALADIIGCCFLIDYLKISKLYSSPLNVGQGWVKAAHGTLPVPPPAVGELLKNIPVYSAWEKEELVTPTGAAIISTLVEEFLPFPQLIYEKIGYGAGSRDLSNLSNILRVFYGPLKNFKQDKKIYVIETNIDDSNPQVLGSFIDQSLQLGALDVSYTPVVMKKNRLGTQLTIVAEIDKIDSLINSIFRETTTIGVRYFPVERRTLKRERQKVELFGEKITIKISYLEGEKASIQPEFSECLKLAKKKDLPVKDIIQMAIQQYHKND
ncbi:MAG: nickel pincer cofactor biosynthesis protein LarC [Candidatus Aminicenantaceae bacterium]